MNKFRSFTILVVMLSTLFILNACTGAKGNTKADKISSINKMRSANLAELYKLAPEARQEIANAYGYAVFDHKSIYILEHSSGNVYGVARNNKSGKDTYMKMLSAGAGVGMGVRTYAGIFIFANQSVYDYFLETGLTGHGSADIAAKYKDQGESVSLGIDVSPGVRLYQITESGLAFQATLQGTKFWKDDELN